jgi:hypothetical protein
MSQSINIPSVPQLVTATSIGAFNTAVAALPSSTYISGSGWTRSNVLKYASGKYQQTYQVQQQTSDYLGIWRPVVVKLGLQTLPGGGINRLR